MRLTDPPSTVLEPLDEVRSTLDVAQLLDLPPSLVRDDRTRHTVRSRCESPLSSCCHAVRSRPCDSTIIAVQRRMACTGRNLTESGRGPVVTRRCRLRVCRSTNRMRLLVLYVRSQRRILDGSIVTLVSMRLRCIVRLVCVENIFVVACWS